MRTLIMIAARAHPACLVPYNSATIAGVKAKDCTICLRSAPPSPPHTSPQSLNKGNERSNIIVASAHIADGASALLNWAAVAGDFMPAAKVASASPELRLQQQVMTERLGYSFVKLGVRRACPARTSADSASAAPPAAPRVALPPSASPFLMV